MSLVDEHVEHLFHSCYEDAKRAVWSNLSGLCRWRPVVVGGPAILELHRTFDQVAHQVQDAARDVATMHERLLFALLQPRSADAASLGLAAKTPLELPMIQGHGRAGFTNDLHAGLLRIGGSLARNEREATGVCRATVVVPETLEHVARQALESSLLAAGGGEVRLWVTPRLEGLDWLLAISWDDDKDEHHAPLDFLARQDVRLAPSGPMLEATARYGIELQDARLVVRVNNA